MTAGDGFEVATTQLSSYATKIDTVAGDIARAEQAGAAVQLDAQAYGQLCTMVPQVVGFLQGLILDCMHTAQESARGTAERLRGAATTYPAGDEDHAAQFTELGGNQ